MNRKYEKFCNLIRIFFKKCLTNLYLNARMLVMENKIVKTFKFRLKPNKEQKHLFAQFAGATRFVFNRALEQIKKASESGQKFPNYNDAASVLVRMKLNDETAWLKKIHSQVLQQSLMDLYNGINLFFTNRKNKKRRDIRFPKFKKKGHKASFRFPQSVQCEGGKVNLPKIGWVSYKNSRLIEGTIKQATIILQGEHWYVCIVCEIEIEIPEMHFSEDDAVGIDVGISCYIATSDGETIPNPAYFYVLLDRLRYQSKALSRKKRFSRNWQKCRLKLQQLHIRIANLRKDFLHKISTILANSHGVLCVEDLHIKGMVKNRKLARAISDAAWGKFYEFLRYKCEWLGKCFVKIDRFYPSSKLCSECGNKQDMPLDIRVFHCELCDLKIDRDTNASLNIRAAGLADLRACGAIRLNGCNEAGSHGF